MLFKVIYVTADEGLNILNKLKWPYYFFSSENLCLSHLEPIVAGIVIKQTLFQQQFFLLVRKVSVTCGWFLPFALEWTECTRWFVAQISSINDDILATRVTILAHVVYFINHVHVYALLKRKLSTQDTAQTNFYMPVKRSAVSLLHMWHLFWKMHQINATQWNRTNFIITVKLQ